MTVVLRLLAIGLLSLLVPFASFAQADIKKDYVIGAGDVLRINVYQNADLSVEARVSEAGTISYPLLGQVRMSGLSIGQAEKAITDGLRNGNYVRQPQVNVLVSQVRGNQVSVLGVVGKPGRYPIEIAGMRMSEVLAAAGGIASGGSDILSLIGVRDGKPMRVQIDIGRLATSGSLDQDPVVQNGDMIYVDRMPMIYIYGEVAKPGSFRLERGMTVMQALATGGGVNQRGTVKGLKIHRRGADGKVRELEPAMTDAMVDGDVIFVRESLF